MTPQIFPASRLSIMVVAGAFFLEVLDAAIMTPALVAIAGTMDTGLDAATISVANYGLALALFTPLGGSLFPKITLKQKVLMGIAIFGVGSALCALSHSLYQLGAGRMVQGLGSALMVPAGRTLILSQPPEPPFQRPWRG
jgi:MFS family permease